MNNLEVKILSFEDMLGQNDEAIVDFLDFIPEKYWDYALLYVEKVKKKYPCDLAAASWYNEEYELFFSTFSTLEPGDNLHDILQEIEDENLDFIDKSKEEFFEDDDSDWDDIDLVENFSCPAGSEKSRLKFFKLLNPDIVVYDVE